VRGNLFRGPIFDRSGATVIKNILFVVIIVGLLIGVFKIAPPYYREYVLQDTMVSDAKFATSYPWKTPEGLRDDVYKEVVRLGIDEVKKEDIHVECPPTHDYAKVTIAYTVTVDLYVYQFQIQFNPIAENRT
jgi:hypothetical protein